MIDDLIIYMDTKIGQQEITHTVYRPLVVVCPSVFFLKWKFMRIAYHRLLLPEHHEKTHQRCNAQHPSRAPRDTTPHTTPSTNYCRPPTKREFILFKVIIHSINKQYQLSLCIYIYSQTFN